VISLGSEGGAGNLIIAEVVKLHINEAILDEEGKIDAQKIDTVARMGGNWYNRSKLGMFEVPKPLRTMGIGVDALPEAIRNSKILTGNDLGMLANVSELPSKKEAEEFIAGISKRCPHLKGASSEEIHKKAQELLKEEKVLEAWKLLLA
jgi:hypothetical protein